MTEVEPLVAADERIEIGAPALAVWSLRHDFTRLPEYNPSVREVAVTRPAGADGVGAEYRFELTGGPNPQPVVLTVTESEPGRLVSAAMEGPVVARERFSIEETEPGRSEARLVLWLDLDAATPKEMIDALVDHGVHQVRDELATMKRLVEAPPG